MNIPPYLSGVFYGATPRTAQSGNSSNLLLPPRLTVLHATDNATASAQDEAHYAATRMDARSKWSSAHFYVDDFEIIGSVPLNLQAWAAFEYANAHGWHIEMCGLSDHIRPATILRTVGLVQELVSMANQPIVHLGPAEVGPPSSGITGHRDITLGLHVGDHTDPGITFDWPRFINLVKGPTVTSPFTGAYGPVEDAARVLAIGATYNGGFVDPVKYEELRHLNLHDIEARLTAAINAQGGLTDQDRQLIRDLTAAVTKLDNRLATP